LPHRDAVGHLLLGWAHKKSPGFRRGLVGCWRSLRGGLPPLPKQRSLVGAGVTQNFYANDFDEKALSEMAGRAASDAGMGF
jgi:hypothetical protein